MRSRDLAESPFPEEAAAEASQEAAQASDAAAGDSAENDANLETAE